jgi:hypothetical protein
MTQEELWEKAYKSANLFLRVGLDKAKAKGYVIEYNEETNEFMCVPSKEETK